MESGLLALAWPNSSCWKHVEYKQSEWKLFLFVCVSPSFSVFSAFWLNRSLDKYINTPKEGACIIGQQVKLPYIPCQDVSSGPGCLISDPTFC